MNRPSGIIFTVMIFVFALTGCARVKVGGSKEPIKVDISMRLDIYQHVQSDIEAIENIVSGAKEKPKTGGGQSFLEYFISSAHAQEGLGPEVEDAAVRRRGRRSELARWQEQGVIGENRLGLLEIRVSEKTDLAVQEMVNAENSDRMSIYRAIAGKNNTSVEQVQNLYAKRLQVDAPAGTPVEELNQSTGAYEWRSK